MRYLKQIIKSNRILYLAYFYVGSFFLRLLSRFVKTDDNLILYVVYGGQRYDDSPRFVYEYMIRNKERYRNFKHIWAFINPQEMRERNIPVSDMVKIDTLAYYLAAMRAKYWITNSSASRGLDFMKKDTVNVFFTHGMTAIKRVGKDIPDYNVSFSNVFKERQDYIVIEGTQEETICRRVWDAQDSVFLNTGLPRNDELTRKTAGDIAALKSELGVPPDKKVILYAPTYREYSRDSMFAVYLKPPFDFDKWNQALGDRYVLLLTAHYEVAKLMDVSENHPFVVNAFRYPYINDLLLVSDLLISDYSSVIFDYSILGRPIISYAYDFDTYSKQRGVYPGYEDIFSHGVMRTEDEVIAYIQSLDKARYDEECEYTRKKIRDVYIAHYGDATEKAVEAIFKA